MVKKTLWVVLPILAIVVLYAIGKYVGLITPAQTSLSVPSKIIPNSDTSPSPVSEKVSWKVVPVVQGLFVPWSIAFTSPTRYLITERNGNVRVVENGKLLPKPIHTFTEVVKDQEEGLMGMTIDPKYRDNQYVYFVYAYPSGKTYTDKVVRFTDKLDHLEDETLIIDHIPAARVHAGSRIKFGPDRKLYVTTGDATDKKNPQNLQSLGGKILRLNADGTIPSDNPFPASPVWSYGHRNPQGMDWNPVTQTFIATEHGPSGFDGPLGGDEVNVIKKGENYGWPVVSHDKHHEGMRDPLLVFTPAVAPAAGLFYTGDLFPQWKNHFFFAMLKGEGIMEVVFADDNPEKVESFTKLPNLNVGRIREIVQGPDGSMYFTTSNEDGRGNRRDGDDAVYQITKN